MDIRSLNADDPADTAALVRFLRDGPGTRLEDYGVLPGDAYPPRLLGGFEEDRLVAAGIFRDLHDPELMAGNTLDMNSLRDLLDDGDVELLNIALLHALGDEDQLALRCGLLVQDMERVLDEKQKAYALFITLMVEANSLAFPLYDGLGFRPIGKPTALVELEPGKVAPLLALHPPGEGKTTLRFMDERRPGDREGLAACYCDVFVNGPPEAGAQVLDRVLASPHFAPDLSLLIEERGSGRIVGFILNYRTPGEDRLHLGIAGILKPWRGTGLIWRLAAELVPRVSERGLTAARGVTSHEWIVGAIRAGFGGRLVDRMVTLVKAG